MILANKEKVEASNSEDNDEALLMDEDISFLLNRDKFDEDHLETNLMIIAFLLKK